MIYAFDEFELDTEKFELRRNGVAFPIEPQVFELLRFFAQNNERMISRDELVREVWGGRVVSEAAISGRVKAARRALGDDGKLQRFIKTVHGKGFRFVARLLVPAEPAAVDSEPALQPIHDEPTRPAVAVLPFINMSGDPEQEYFADAISQDIITNLSKHRWLDVIARNTTFGYKGKAVDVRRIGEELGASYVVDGSVRRSGQRIRVSVQLVDTESGSQRWADRYDRNLEDVFAVQDEITAKIVARVEPEIGAAERRKVVRADRHDLRAWEYYHLGVYHFFRFTAVDNRLAQDYLAKSRSLDPNFGEAHAWWAYAVILGMVYWDTDPSQELLDEALEASGKALELDDQNAVFYALKARVQLARCEYDSALTENQIAINLNPTFAAAHCGLGDSLAYEGRYDEAIERFQKAIELSPNDPQRWAFLTYGALAHIFRRDFRTAIEWSDRAREIPNCQYWTIAHKAVALAHLGEIEKAKQAALQLLREKPDFCLAFARKKLFYLKEPGQLELYLQGLELAGLPA